MKTKAEIQERLIILTAMRLKLEKDRKEQNTCHFIEDQLISINDQITLLKWVIGE